MNKIFKLVILCALLVTLLLTSCGYKSAVIGVWTEKIATLAFQRDGTVTSRFMGLGIQGTYMFLDKDTIRITFVGKSIDYKIRISNGIMHLESNGIKLIYEKIK